MAIFENEKDYLPSYNGSTNTTNKSYYMMETTSSIMKNVYLWMALALSVSGLTAWAVASSVAIQQVIFGSPIALWGVVIAQFVIVIALTAALQKLSVFTASLMFLLYSILTGITLSVIFLAYTEASIASTFFITAGTFAGVSLYGYTTKADMTKMGNYLFMALIGLIIASLVNWFMHSDALQWMISAAGVLIFVGLTAYDTQKIRQAVETQADDTNEGIQKIALIGALELYLDFINLFLYLLRFLGKKK